MRLSFPRTSRIITDAVFITRSSRRAEVVEYVLSPVKTKRDRHMKFTPECRNSVGGAIFWEKEKRETIIEDDCCELNEKVITDSLLFLKLPLPAFKGDPLTFEGWFCL